MFAGDTCPYTLLPVTFVCVLCNLVQRCPTQSATMLTVCLLSGNGHPTHLYAEDAQSSREQSHSLVP